MQNKTKENISTGRELDFDIEGFIILAAGDKIMAFDGAEYTAVQTKGNFFSCGDCEYPCDCESKKFNCEARGLILLKDN